MNQPLEPYRRLAEVYDSAWSDFCHAYEEIVAPFIDGQRNPSVLDLACGTGELLLRLSRSAVSPDRCVGIDISAHMVDQARRKVPGVEFRVSDMLSLELDRTFDLVVCTHDAVNYLVERDEFGRFLETARSHLAAHGHLAFDFTTDAGYRALHGRERRTHTFRGTVTQTTLFDTATQIAETRFTFADGSTEIHRQRARAAEEMRQIVEAHGFDVLEEYDADEEESEDEANGEPRTEIWILRHRERGKERRNVLSSE